MTTLAQYSGFAEEYQRLRHEGYDHDEIAEVFGVKDRDSVIVRAKRHGCYLPEPNAFVENYTFLRRHGVIHEHIADRFCVSVEALIRRAFRNNCYIPEPEEAKVLSVMQRLIDSGNPFHRDQLPGEPDTVSNLLQREMKSGRIERVAPRRTWARNAGHYYQKAKDTK